MDECMDSAGVDMPSHHDTSILTHGEFELSHGKVSCLVAESRYCWPIVIQKRVII